MGHRGKLLKSLFGKGQVKIGKVGQSLPDFSNVRVDRKTVFGNPKSVMEVGRTEACEYYEKYADNCMREAGAYQKAMNKLRIRLARGENILLQCHCVDVYTGKGKRCHAQTIMRILLR